MFLVDGDGGFAVFWEQQGTTPFGGQRLQITRPPIASQPAFNKHFTSLLAAYPHIQIVDLLGSKDHEALLSTSFQEHVKALNAQLGEKEEPLLSKTAGGSDIVGYTEFDFHREVRNAGGIESVRDLIKRDPHLGGSMEYFGYCLAAIDEKNRETFLNRQEGVFRTNCLDCLECVQKRFK